MADELIAIQTQVRINTIALPPIEWKGQEAIAFAKANQLDLQTAQAQVTDAWRRVYVAANALRAGLDLVASMS